MVADGNKAKAISPFGSDWKIILQYIASCDCIAGKIVTAHN
jgi:hypothetical protein